MTPVLSNKPAKTLAGGIELLAQLICAMIFVLATGSAAYAACKNPDALGVSRTVEIETKNGPKYGLQQYKKHDFLKDKEIVLTFDDGPAAIYTNPILKALKEHCTKATFFMVGRMARHSPALVKKIAALGHTVGTHTWSHQNLGNRSKKRGIREIELGVSMISKALGRPAAPFFRFPYLAGPKRMIKHLQERNIAIFSIDVDSKDYQTRSGERVTNRILRGLKRAGKGIILFHDIQKSTAKALPGLLEKLKDRGYKVVHIKPKNKGTTEATFDKKIAALSKKKSDAAEEHKKTSRKAKRRKSRRRARARKARSRHKNRRSRHKRRHSSSLTITTTRDRHS